MEIAPGGLPLALSVERAVEEVALPVAATVTDLVRLVEKRGQSPFRPVLRD